MEKQITHNQLNSMLNWKTWSPTGLSVVVGALLLGGHWLTGGLPPVVSWTFFGLALLLAGIPHGALDHLVDEQTAYQHGRIFRLDRFLFRYLLTMLAYGLLWWWQPALSLIVFLVFSAWHFGETDVDPVPPKAPLWMGLRFVHGGFVLFFLLLGHAAETTPILDRISRHDPWLMQGWNVLVQHESDILLGWGRLLLIGVVLTLQWSPIAVNQLRLARLVLLLAICLWLPLMPAFALYFGGWHSISAFQAIGQYLRRNNAGPLSARQIWVKALPLTGLALLGLLLMIGSWYWFARQIDPVPVIFIFLSLITLPHLGVMSGMNQQRALQSALAESQIVRSKAD